jgi:hypothetical protein
MVERQLLDVARYVEPRSVRHALARSRVWLLRELETNPHTEYSLEECFQLECIFFHIPKTAGLALNGAFFGNRGLGHIDVRTARVLFGERRFRSFFKFCFVRNPWDRLVSAYHYLRAGHVKSPIADAVAECSSFTEFVLELLASPEVAREQHIRPQASFVTTRDGRLAVDFVGRFERLEQDFRTVRRRLGVDARLASRNESSHNDYRAYYTPETRDAVGKFYGRDVALFGYGFGD